VKKEVLYDEKKCLGIRKVLDKKTQFQKDRLYEKLMKRPPSGDLEAAKPKMKGKKNEKSEDQ